MGANLVGGVGWAGAEAGDIHREEVVDVVAEEAGLREGEVEFVR